MIFFTSDHHFSHANIIKYCNRPFSDVNHMNEELIKRWNFKVSDDDTIYVLGDFSLRSEVVAKVSPRLKGKKILIHGNHDACFKKESKSKVYYDSGWQEVIRETRGVPLVLSDGREVIMSHLPYTNHDERYIDKLPKNEGKWLLHGHVHEKWKIKDMGLNIGVDQWDFYPVSEAEVVEAISAVERGCAV